MKTILGKKSTILAVALSLVVAAVVIGAIYYTSHQKNIEEVKTLCAGRLTMKELSEIEASRETDHPYIGFRHDQLKFIRISSEIDEATGDRLYTIHGIVKSAIVTETGESDERNYGFSYTIRENALGKKRIVGEHYST